MPYRELRSRLKAFGIVEHQSTGRTSRRFFVRRDAPDSGPFYPVNCKGEGREIEIPEIHALLRRFDIKPAAFWA